MAKKRKKLTKAQKADRILLRATEMFEALNDDGVYDIRETAQIAAAARTVAAIISLTIR